MEIEEKLEKNWRLCKTCRKLCDPQDFLQSYRKFWFSTTPSVRKCKKCKKCREQAISQAKASLADVQERLLNKQTAIYRMAIYFYKAGIFEQLAFHYKYLHKPQKEAFAWHKCYEYKKQGLQLLRVFCRMLTGDQQTAALVTAKDIEISLDEVKAFAKAGSKLETQPELESAETPNKQ